MIRTRVLSFLLLLALPGASLEAQASDPPHVDVQAGSLGQARLELGAWIQSRWAHLAPGGAGPDDGFSLTRARLDLRGEVLGGAVAFRIQPELSGTPSLRDAYVEVSLWPGARIRVGQYPVPFQWRVSPKREQLPEGGATQDEFGTPTGRDVGVLLESDYWGGRGYYALGLYSGEGRNRRLPATSGYLVASRVGWALNGWIPRDESDWERRPESRISLGAGVEAASRNRGRDWGADEGVSGVEADWVTAMVDFQVQRRGLAASAEAYWRQVSPQPDEYKAFIGWGAGVSAAYALPTPHPLEGVLRFQWLQRDRSRTETRLSSTDVGLNLYVRGHGLKVRAFASHMLRNSRVAADRFVLDLNLLVG